MIFTTLLLLTISELVKSSGVAHFAAAPVAGLASAAVFAPSPYVAAQSSQYFERNFNRLVAAPVVPQPVIPVAPAAPVAPPPVFVEPVTRTVPVPVPVTPTQNVPAQVTPTQQQPLDPNVAIAIATAQAAAPGTTILLPPYHFVPQHNFGFVHSVVVPDVDQKNQTTQATTVSPKEPEPTTPLPSPSNTDNSFAQLPTNQNPNIQQVYGPPELPRPLPPARPQKLRTSVEVVPQPLAYIAPPPIPQHHHHHHHHHHGHAVKYVHSYVPAKLIVRPVHVHTVRVPAKLVIHKAPVRRPQQSRQVLRPRVDTAKDVEPTTFKPFRPNTKPPRL